MKTNYYILTILCLVVLNIALTSVHLRADLSSDKRYTLSETSCSMLRGFDNEGATFKADLWLAGGLNAGFSGLSRATADLLREMSEWVDIEVATYSPNELSDSEQEAIIKQLSDFGYHPVQVYENTGNAERRQTIVYPFLRLADSKRSVVVPLLLNDPTQSGADNLNHSLESLEYTLMRALSELKTDKRPKVAFIEGHGELPEIYTLDLQQALSRYCDVYYGSLTNDAGCLDDFNCIVIADPTQPFSERDKYIIDQYIMHSGNVLWTLSGVRFSEQVLSTQGFTPVLPLDLNIQDMLFKYGIRINADLVQDLQCLPLSVDMSADPNQHDYHTLPFTYSPLLLTATDNPITRNLPQVSAPFASTVEFVGDSEGQDRRLLLATSSNSRITAAPARVDLGDLSPDLNAFNRQLLPVAVSIDGEFTSLFAHRLVPDSVTTSRQTLAQGNARQVIVACGNSIRNEVQSGKPLPLGYDRVSKLQFGNRDFFVNAILYLTDRHELLSLRQKSLTLRLLNRQLTHQRLTLNRIVSILLPLSLLAIAAAAVGLTRKRKYTNNIQLQ